MEMGFGTLKIRAYIAEGAYPLEGVVCTITGVDEWNRDISLIAVTDSDGVTEPISLPAPDRIYSQSAAAKEPSYSSYDVVVSKENYYTKRIRQVPVFSGVDAVLPVNMIPYVDYKDGGTYPRGNINSTVYENEMLE